MRKIVVLQALCMAIGGVFAGEQPKEESLDMNVQMSGYLIWDAGYVGEMADAEAKTWKSEPFTDVMGGIRLSAHPTDNLMLTINPEMRSHYLMPMQHGLPGGSEARQRAKWDAYMEEAKSEWTIGDTKRPFATVGLGYMIYKENPDAKIFGDYLFRSMIYPGLVFTKFNYPQTQIFGLALKNNLGENFSHNLFLLSETKNYPFFDLSLAYTAVYSYKNLVEVGAGVNYRSLIPVRPSKTTPSRGSSVDNTYKEIGLQTRTLRDSATGPIARMVTIRQAVDSITLAPINFTDIIITDSMGVLVDSSRVAGIGANGMKDGPLTVAAFTYLINPVTGSPYVELGATETKYSFSGAILTGRIAVNPLGFMPTNPLGKDALKVYLEVALLGLKDYPGYYEKKNERMPIMFGIHLPTMNMVDFLSAEFEYFPSKLIPTHEVRSFDNVPQPGTHKTQLEGAWDDARRKKDDFKWGLAAKKSFRGFSLVAQAGSDHMRMEDKNGEAYLDMFTRPAHWYAQFRFIGGIY